MKTKQLTLVLCEARVINHLHDEFIVTQAQDTVEYLPGARLMKPEVDALCRNGAWKIKIIRPAEKRL